ncbi:hypothetical protein ABW19_dt0205252 [Dactylella cylindrospora]|nr:hypothetical protein ABW19_dt0205252 [Dactylella cylindrospora]
MLFADKIGRKYTILWGAITSCIGAALQAGAVNMTMLIIGRFIGGASIGMLTSTIPMYAAELSEAKHWPFQYVPGIILISGIWFLTESPRWLMEKDRYDEVRVVLERLRGDGIDDEQVELEFRDLRGVIAAERAAGNTSWKKIITKPSWRKRLILGCGVQAFGPLSGINVIDYYGPQIYRILDIQNQTALMIIDISGALSIVYCTIGLLLLDRFGRVKPLITSAAGLAAALVVNAAQAQHLDPSNRAQARSMMAMNFVFSFFYTPLQIIS